MSLGCIGSGDVARPTKSPTWTVAEDPCPLLHFHSRQDKVGGLASGLPQFLHHKIILITTMPQYCCYSQEPRRKFELMRSLPNTSVRFLACFTPCHTIFRHLTQVNLWHSRFISRAAIPRSATLDGVFIFTYLSTTQELSVNRSVSSELGPPTHCSSIITYRPPVTRLLCGLTHSHPFPFFRPASTSRSDFFRPEQHDGMSFFNT